MNTSRITTSVGVLASACALLTASTSHAAVAQYHVDVITSPLAGNPAGPFYLDFQMNFGSGSGNSATINNFTYSTGSSTGSPVLSGNVSGDLGSSASLWAASATPFNEIYQGFTPGNTLGFNVSITTNPTGDTPDTLAFAILNSDLFQIATTDPLGLSLAQFDITDTGLNVNAFSGTFDFNAVVAGTGFTTFNAGIDYTGVKVTITAVPEPSTFIGAFAVAGLIAARALRARKTA